MKRQFPLFLVAVTLQLSISAQNASPYWSTAGNSNATASSKLGTTTNVPLRLFTNNVERLRIDGTGKVGIGTTVPRGKLTLYNGSSTPTASWITTPSPMLVSYADGAGGNGDLFLTMASNTATTRSNIIARRARGTLAAPTAVVNNDYITSLQASGYDGSAFQNPANVDFFVDGTPSAGNVPVRISFSTGTNLGNRTERVKILSNGNIAFNNNQLFVLKATGNVGIGTTAPVNKLDVMGTIRGYVPSYDINGNPTGGGAGVEGFGSTGVRATSDYRYGTGLEANGFIGINASGHDIAIVGYSDQFSGIYGGSGTVEYYDYVFENVGVIGASTTNIGVKGVGIVGVEGRGSEWGVYGEGDIGIYGTGTTHAGVFYGDVYLSNGYTTSDKNLKKNVKEFGEAMTLINKLKPKHYEFKEDAKLASLRLPKGKHYGLIAQEVEEVLPNLVKGASHQLFDTAAKSSVSKTKDGKVVAPGKMQKREVLEKVNIKAVNYTELIPIMIKGMQELNKKIEEIDELKEENKRLKEEMAELRQMVLNLNKGSSGTVSAVSGSLEQSVPNPVRGTAVIRYTVPLTAASASIAITNAKGQVVRTISINNKGTEQVTFNSTTLAAGTYNYTLYVDGKQADTKRLIVAR